METKQILGVVLIALGGLALIMGVLGIFGQNVVSGVNPWALAILGIVFFPSGIGLLKTIRSTPSE